MPLALNSELKGYWNLGPTLCDMWVSFDVTSCTASILNLCMISVDRYLTITKPLTYGVKRTTKRMLLFISAVWLTSCLIIVPPLLILGNEHGTEEEPKCQVSQNIGYQLYATLASFYIPLVVMIIVYYKIYISAKHVLDAELKSLAPTSTKYFTPIKPLLASSPDSDLELGNREKLKARLNYCEEGSGQRWINLENNNSKFDKDVKIVQPSDAYSKNGLVVKSGDSMISKPNFLHISISPSYKKVKDTLIPHKSQSNKKKYGVNDASNKEMYSRTLVNNVMCINEKGRTSLMIKERKASITLGVIMTAFTVCWLPFFILALLRPFSQTIADIPHWISSFAFWLGLANSMLNPIIYVTFHHDFRQAFRYLLCLQCSTMDLRLREEAYQSQYGMESREIIKNKTSASRAFEECGQNRI
jgi:PREDICTED: similar to serotonin receptor